MAEERQLSLVVRIYDDGGGSWGMIADDDQPAPLAPPFVDIILKVLTSAVWAGQHNIEGQIAGLREAGQIARKAAREVLRDGN